MIAVLAQVRDHGAELGDQSVGGCVAFRLAGCGRCSGNERREGAKQFRRFDLPFTRFAPRSTEPSRANGAEDCGFGRTGSARRVAECECHGRCVPFRVIGERNSCREFVNEALPAIERNRIELERYGIFATAPKIHAGAGRPELAAIEAPIGAGGRARGRD
jgi:hypothetical protein